MNTTTMTDPELNLTIAELCGLSHPFGFTKLREALDIYKNRDDQGMCLLTLAKIPNYSQDLNAMNRIEPMLLDRFLLYIESLKQVTWNSQPHEMSWEDYDGPWDMHAIATARQRAEAFIAAFAK